MLCAVRLTASAASRADVLSVSIETTRTNNVPAEIGALPTALSQVRGTNVDTIAAENAAWWKRWWETGATIELGPRRQTLERFWCESAIGQTACGCHSCPPLMASVCVCEGRRAAVHARVDEPPLPQLDQGQQRALP